MKEPAGDRRKQTKHGERKMCERKKGIVKRVSARGFGFLFCEGIERDIYFHFSNWRSGDEPFAGQKVTFEFAPGKREGLPEQAVAVYPDSTAGIAALAKGGVE